MIDFSSPPAIHEGSRHGESEFVAGGAGVI